MLFLEIFQLSNGLIDSFEQIFINEDESDWASSSKVKLGGMLSISMVVDIFSALFVLLQKSSTILGGINNSSLPLFVILVMENS